MLFFILLVAFSVVLALKYFYIALLVLLLNLAVIVVYSLFSNREHLFFLLAVFITFLFMICSYVALCIKQNSNQKILYGLSGKHVIVQGIVVKQNYDYMDLKIDSVNYNDKLYKVKLKIVVKSNKQTFYTFERVQLAGKISKGKKGFLLYSTGGKSLQKSGIGWLFTFKKMYTESIKANMPEPYASLFVGLILGDSDVLLDSRLVGVFKDLGLIHILVVSGAQVAIINNFLLIIIRLFTINKKIQFAAIALADVLFLLIVGFDVSITRAVFMAIFSFYLISERRKIEAIEVLCLTGSVMLMLSPDLVLNYGFILSFLATYALLEVNPRLEHWMSNYCRIPKRMASTLSVAMAPFLCTLPVVIVLNSKFDYLSVFANIIILPIVEVLTLLGFALMITFFVPLVSFFIFKAVLGLQVIMLFIANIFYCIPNHSITLKQVLYINVFAYYALFVMLVYKRKPRKDEVAGVVIFCLFLLVINYIMYPGAKVIIFDKDKEQFFVLQSGDKQYVFSKNLYDRHLKKFLDHNLKSEFKLLNSDKVYSIKQKGINVDAYYNRVVFKMHNLIYEYNLNDKAIYAANSLVYNCNDSVFEVNVKENGFLRLSH